MATPLVKGTPVISLSDGSTLGAIDHVYFDPERMAVVGFTFHQGGGLFGHRSSGLVDITDVHAFGSDAVTITDVSVVRSDVAIEPMREHLLELEHLLKRKVMTDAGMLVGQVAAIQFGDGSYKVTALDVIETGSHKHIHIDAARIQKIGEELIIVSDPATVAAQPGQLKQALRVVTSRPAVHQGDSRSA